MTVLGVIGTVAADANYGLIGRDLCQQVRQGRRIANRCVFQKFWTAVSQNRGHAFR